MVSFDPRPMAKSPSHQPALHEFFRWERQSWVEVVADGTTDDKAYFMPVDSLKSYFKGNGGRKLNKILSEVFQSEDVPVDPELILRGHTAVFCILLRISKGRYIEDFAYFEELSDQRLPFDPAHPPSHFPEDVDDPGFLQRFCETQWMYCVPVFDSHMLHKYFGRQRLLPITQKEQCESGGSAAMYKIKLYGPHNKLVPAGSEIQINNTDQNTFMLKRYMSKTEYRQEVKNFSNSKHSESIIKFHGSYSHGNDYNILLEYADKGSLEDYFQKQTPPSRGGDIIKFWDNLFHLIKALKAIHSFLGGHHDVRPASVLALSYGAESAFDWHFKLADFGKGDLGSNTKSSEDRLANEFNGTQPYGAPECSSSHSEDGQRQKRSSRSTQAADIWSLGCIYSEAAVWIADGYSGVVNYRRQRMAEIEKLPDTSGEDSFHDGEKVLKAVLHAHKEIELRLRRSDNITKDVLDSMVEEMLWEEDRPGAKALWRRAEAILSRARQKLSSSTTEGSTTRPTSSSTNRSRPYHVPLSQSPPHPPPERPLPERPRGSSSRSSSTTRQSPANVELWRTLVRVPSRELASSVYGGSRTNPESISEHDTDALSSTSGWQGGNRESVTSAITSPLPSPHASSTFDFSRQASVEVRGRRPLPQSQRSSSLQKPGRRPYKQSSVSNNNAESSDEGLGAFSSAQLYAKYLQEGAIESLTENSETRIAVYNNAKILDRDDQSVSSVYTSSIPLPQIQPLQSLSSVQTLQPAQPLQPIQPLQLLQTSQTAQSFQPLQPLQPFQSFQPIQPLQPLQIIQPLSPLQTPQPFQPLEPLSIPQPLQPVLPVATIEYNMPLPTIPNLASPPQNPPKRFAGLSLFPNRANKKLPLPPPIAIAPMKDSTIQEQRVARSDSYSSDSIGNLPIKQYTTSQYTAVSYEKDSNQSESPLTRSDSISTRSLSTIPTSQYGSYTVSGQLSLAGVLDWKKAHKKSKKNARVPPVRGADLLDKCNNRDHVFIIDDGVAMREQWPQVKIAFEALSYVLKPMAPDGIELFFTNAYDAWRRHNTGELVDLLEKKGLQGETDILYRLRLQLQDYIVKALPISQVNSKKAKKNRPISFYILTNGNWKDKTSPYAAIKEIADHLIQKDMEKGQVTIQFVTFGHNAPALQQIYDIANTDFGIDLVDTTPSSGDVLKMLCGPLDKNYFAGGDTVSRAASSASTLMLPLTTTSLPPIELA